MTYQEKQAVVSAAAEKALRKIGATEHPNGQNNWQIGNTVISVHADAYANKVNIRPAALNDSRGKYYDGYRHNQRPESSLSIGPSLGSYLKRRAEEWADVYADYARALAAHNQSIAEQDATAEMLESIGYHKSRNGGDAYYRQGDPVLEVGFGGSVTVRRELRVSKEKIQLLIQHLDLLIELGS